MFRNREISMNHIQPLMTMLSKEFIEILTFSGALQVFINFFLKCDNFRQVFCSNFIFDVDYLICYIHHWFFSFINMLPAILNILKMISSKYIPQCHNEQEKNVTTIRECIFWTCRTLNWMRSIFYSIQT